MIKLSEEAKQHFSKYVGPDGKLIIDDSVPQELRETFQFFNDKGINILDMNINDDIEILDEPDTVSDDIESDDYSNGDSNSEFSSTIVEDDSNVDLDDLNNLFE